MTIPGIAVVGLRHCRARATSSATAPLRLFGTSGEYEPGIDFNMAVYAAQVRQRVSPVLAFGTARYADDTHALTPMASLSDGLRFVFARVSLSRRISDYLQSATPDSTMWMQAFDLGLPSDLLPEFAYRESATSASNTNPGARSAHFGAAHVIASRYLSTFPMSAAAHTMLGDVLLKQRDMTG